MTQPTQLPSFETLIEDLTFFDDWDDRYRYLIDLGKMLPSLPIEGYCEANKVQGCASQVWLMAEREAASGRLTFHADSDAFIVKGLVALVVAMFSGKTAAEIARIDAQAQFAAIGLKDHLTAQRSNGLASMVRRIQDIAAG
jgi:cysteine desulfuration protein SufE